MDINTNFIVDTKNLKKSVELFHNHFFDIINKKNVFILGYGNIGKYLFKICKKRNDVNVIGLANSKYYIYDFDGIDKNINEIPKVNENKNKCVWNPRVDARVAKESQNQKQYFKYSADSEVLRGGIPVSRQPGSQGLTILMYCTRVNSER